MKKNSLRLTQLDGLRGIAILLVIFTHLRIQPIIEILPWFLRFPAELVTGSGKTGVMILFVLSGFLMAHIYPVIEPSLSGIFTFWQKRYTRIFPGFLALCTSLSIVRFFWRTIPLWSIPLIVLMTVIPAGMIWRRLQMSKHREVIGKLLFKTFLSIQVLVALSYIFLLSQVPSAVYYLVWPKWIQAIVTWVVNSTLTLPFGQYVPQLDGVYWSIEAEVLFYLLYPIVFLPVISLLRRAGSNKFSSWKVVGAILCSLPFFYGLSLTFDRILGFQILQIHLISSFAGGIALGFAQKTNILNSFNRKLKQVPWLICTFLALAGILGAPIFFQNSLYRLRGSTYPLDLPSPSYILDFSPGGDSLDSLA